MKGVSINTDVVDEVAKTECSLDLESSGQKEKDRGMMMMSTQGKSEVKVQE